MPETKRKVYTDSELMEKALAKAVRAMATPQERNHAPAAIPVSDERLSKGIKAFYSALTDLIGPEDTLVMKLRFAVKSDNLSSTLDNEVKFGTSGVMMDLNYALLDAIIADASESKKVVIKAAVTAHRKS